MQVGQRKRAGQLAQEGSLLANGVDAGHVQRRLHDGDDRPGESAAAADVQHTSGGAFAVQRRQHGQAVGQMLHQHLRWVTHRRQVVGGVPALQLGQEPGQLVQLPVAGFQLQCAAGGRDLGLQAASSVGSPWAKPLKRPFFRCTSNSEMAAGVTPEIREACPSVSGTVLAQLVTHLKRSVHETCAVIQVVRKLEPFSKCAAALHFADSVCRCSPRTWMTYLDLFYDRVSLARSWPRLSDERFT